MARIHPPQRPRPAGAYVKEWTTHDAYEEDAITLLRAFVGYSNVQCDHRGNITVLCDHTNEIFEARGDAQQALMWARSQIVGVAVEKIRAARPYKVTVDNAERPRCRRCHFKSTVHLHHWLSTRTDDERCALDLQGRIFVGLNTQKGGPSVVLQKALASEGFKVDHVGEIGARYKHVSSGRMAWVYAHPSHFVFEGEAVSACARIAATELRHNNASDIYVCGPHLDAPESSMPIWSALLPW